MSQKSYDAGLEMRRLVLGDEYVDKSIKGVTDFNRPMQELVTKYCWGEIWTRPGLPEKIRSMINLSMLTALNRPNELRTHVHGALHNGCTKEEIQEIFLQTAIYCGVPAALESFKIAQEVFEEE